MDFRIVVTRTVHFPASSCSIVRPPLDSIVAMIIAWQSCVSWMRETCRGQQTQERISGLILIRIVAHGKQEKE